MRELAKKRLNANFKQSLKYLTLVFNDFFILALIFLFGALMFWYARAMRTMPSNLWFYKPIVGLVLWLPLLTGKLVTLLQEADMQFLFPQDEQMKQYLRPMIGYSMVLPTILIVLVSGILFPFATVKAGIPIWSYILLIISAIITKYWQLLLEKDNLYRTNKINQFLYLILPLILLIAGCYFSIGYLILILILCFIASRVNHDKLFDWRYAVKSESTRKERVYSLFSMFTDVAEKQVVIRRRKYLDFLLPKSLAKENPNLFLYRRSLLRNPEYLNLLVRMTVFAILISWLVQDWRWALGLSALVSVMTAYQLLPMATEFDGNIMYRVYPIVRDKRGQDLVKVLALGLLMQWLLISIFWLILLPINLDLMAGIGLLLLVVLIIIYIYFPYHVNRQKIRR